MNRLDSRLFNSTKEALEKLQTSISEEDYFIDLPVIVIDFGSYESKFFRDPSDAEEYIDGREWNSGEPTEGEADDYLVLLHQNEDTVKKYPMVHRDYKFWREINGTRIWRKRSVPEIEFETILNVSL